NVMNRHYGCCPTFYNNGLFRKLNSIETENSILNDLDTGVQTVALPIMNFSGGGNLSGTYTAGVNAVISLTGGAFTFEGPSGVFRSEERRVGTECRFWLVRDVLVDLKMLY